MYMYYRLLLIQCTCICMYRLLLIQCTCVVIHVIVLLCYMICKQISVVQSCTNIRTCMYRDMCLPGLWFYFVDFFQSKGVTDPHKYFYRELDTNLAASNTLITDLMVKSSIWLESWSMDYLKSKGVKIPRQAPPTNQRKSSLRSTKSQPNIKLPACNLIEVINHFVKVEHEKELARLSAYMYYTDLQWNLSN